MSDPMSVGAYAALSLAIVGETALKGAVTKTVEDLYQKLKSMLMPWAQEEVKALEISPDSNGRRLTLAEIIDKNSSVDLTVIRKATDDLKEALRNSGISGPIGYDIGILDAAVIILPEVSVDNGIGVRISNVKTDVFTGGPIQVGKK